MRLLYGFWSGVLRAPQNDPGDGGGGAGGGAGGGKSDPGGKTDGGAAPFTEEQFTAIGEMVNKAFSSRLPKMLNQGIAESFKAMDWAGLLTPVVTNLIPQPAPSGGGGGSGDDGDKSKRSSIDPELTRQLQKLQDDLDKEKQARLQAVSATEQLRKEHQFSAARQRLYESLKPHAAESLHDVWVDHLVHHKRLNVADDGSATLEVEYSPVRGMPKQKEFLPLDEAIQYLVNHDEAKRFQPVRDGNGGGTNPGPRGTNPGKARLDSKDPAERVAARLASLGMDFDQEFSGS